ncbi:MAG: hypothetical protein ABUJ92_00255 [Desulfobacterales bacterium]
MRVKTDYVPERNKRNLTAGKEYEVCDALDGYGTITDDRGIQSCIRFSSGAHLNGRPWTIVEDKMNIKDAYIAMQAQCGIEVGDTAKVLRKAESLEMGWGAVWRDCMEAILEGKVTRNLGGFGLELDHEYTFPFFVLQKIEKKWEPEEYPINYTVYANGGILETRNGTTKSERLYGNESKTREDAEKIEQMNRRNQWILQAKRFKNFPDGDYEIGVTHEGEVCIRASHIHANPEITFETGEQAKEVKEMVGL